MQSGLARVEDELWNRAFPPDKRGGLTAHGGSGSQRGSIYSAFPTVAANDQASCFSTSSS